MTKVKCFIIFVILIVLTGCSERELTFDRIYPNTANLDEMREKRKQEIKEEQKDVAAYIIERNLAPRELYLTLPDDEDKGAYLAKAMQYCWAITEEECVRIQPMHPYDDQVNQKYMPVIRIAANQKLYIRNNLDLISNPIPFPARIEAYIYDDNKNLQLHETVYGTTPGEPFVYTAPSTSGLYMFQFKAYYEGEVEGISYHPYPISVE